MRTADGSARHSLDCPRNTIAHTPTWQENSGRMRNYTAVWYAERKSTSSVCVHSLNHMNPYRLSPSIWFRPVFVNFHFSDNSYPIHPLLGSGGGGLVPWAGCPPDASFGFHLREATQSQTNTGKILYNESRYRNWTDVQQLDNTLNW